jgi:integrase
MSVIRLKFVQSFVDVRGKRRAYFRRPGHARIPLPGLPGSEDFMSAYAAAIAGSEAAPIQIGASRTRPGTVAHLVAAYYDSAEFKHEVADNTRRTRRAVLERLRERHGDKRVATLQTEHVRKMLAKIERPHAKRNWLKALKPLMRFAVEIGLRADDPTEGIKPAKVAKSDGYRNWTDDDIAAFRATHLIGSRARLALELLLGTAQRRGDVIRMGRQHVRTDMIVVRQNKTGKTLNIPLSDQLRAVLDGTPSHHLTFLTTGAGQPFTADGFGHWFREACDQAGLAGLSAHGLRKSACRLFAEAGATEKEIASFSGHSSLNEIARYTRAADQTKLARAAMRKLAQGG